MAQRIETVCAEGPARPAPENREAYACIPHYSTVHTCTGQVLQATVPSWAICHWVSPRPSSAQHFDIAFIFCMLGLALQPLSSTNMGLGALESMPSSISGQSEPLRIAPRSWCLAQRCSATSFDCQPSDAGTAILKMFARMSVTPAVLSLWTACVGRTAGSVAVRHMRALPCAQG